MRRSIGLAILAIALFSIIPCLGRAPGDLLEDPSFELTKDKDQFGLVFAKWGGWNYEGDCEFRVGQVAHTRQAFVPAVRRVRSQDPGRSERRRSNRAGIASPPTCAGSTSAPAPTA